MQNKHIKIPPKKIKGLKVWCPSCNTEVRETCRENLRDIKQCIHREELKYKSVVYDKDGRRKSKTYDTQILEDVIPEHYQFRKQVKSGKDIEAPAKEVQQATEILPAVKNGLKLVDAMSMRTAFLEGERGAEHLREKRKSKNHISDNTRTFIQFAQVLNDKKIDVENLQVEDITDEMVGHYHTFLVKEKKYSKDTYSRCMGNLGSLINYVNEHENGDFKNPFAKVKKGKSKKNPKAVDMSDFKKFLDSIKEEDSIQVLKNGTRKNLWLPDLKKYYIGALLSGLRREQYIEWRYNDIQEDENNIPVMIVSKNLKVNRIMGIEDDDESARVTPTPVTPQLREWLMENNYLTNKNTNKYIHWSDSPLQRKTLMETASKAYSHFWKIAHPDKPGISFKNLRKTFITKMTIAVGHGAKHLVGSSNQEVLNNNYIDKTLIAKVASDKTIFPELDFSEEKQNEQKEIKRKKENDNSIER